MPLNRRQFLKNAANTLAAGVVFPAIVPARALGLDGHVAPSNRIALGLVGTGWGLGSAGKFLRFPDARLAAVCDVDARRAHRAAAAIRRYRPDCAAVVFGDFREMFSRAALDAVLIATPDHWHGVMCVAAARAGLDIYVEAPLSRNPAEGRAIVETARLHGRILQCALVRRSAFEWNRAAAIARSGGLGEITHIEIGSPPTPAYAARPPAPEAARVPPHLDYEMWVGPARWRDYDPRFVHHYWRWVSDFGGGELAGSTFHYADAALRAVGMEHSGPETIRGHARFAVTPPYDVELDYACQFTFANGIQMQVSTKFPRGVKYIGDRAWLHVADDAQGVPFLRASTPEILQPATFTENKFSNANGGAGDSSRGVVVNGETAPNNTSQNNATTGAINAAVTVNNTPNNNGVPAATVPATLSPPPAAANIPANALPVIPTDHWRNFLDSVKTRRPPHAPAEPAHRAATFTQLAHISMLLGRPLHWNPVTETILNDDSAAALLLPTYRQPWEI